MSASSNQVSQLIAYDFSRDQSMEKIFDHINLFSEDEFKNFLKYVQENPIQFLEQNRRSFLDECWCEGSKAHSRKHSLLRQEFEMRVSNAVAHLDRSTPINLLSIGSGGLFQDFMILIKLHDMGFTTIHLDSVEIEAGMYPRLLQKIIDKWNTLCGANITFRAVEELSELPADRNYNSVYAVDLEEMQIYVGLNFSPGADNDVSYMQYRDASKLASLMAEALARLSSDEQSLFWMSCGRDVIAYNGAKDFSKVHMISSFEHYLQESHHFDGFCINANIANIVHHFPYLMAQKKPILLDASMAGIATLEAVVKFLQSRGLESYILNRAEIDEQILSRPGSTLLVIDNSFYTPSALDKDSSYLLSAPHFRTRLNQESFNKTRVAAFNYGQIIPMPFDILPVTPKPEKSLVIGSSNPVSSSEELQTSIEERYADDSFDIRVLINNSFFTTFEAPDRSAAIAKEAIKIITDQNAMTAPI